MPILTSLEGVEVLIGRQGLSNVVGEILTAHVMEQWHFSGCYYLFSFFCFKEDSANLE
jgi:hypothetical protein